MSKIFYESSIFLHQKIGGISNSIVKVNEKLKKYCLYSQQNRENFKITKRTKNTYKIWNRKNNIVLGKSVRQIHLKFIKV